MSEAPEEKPLNLQDLLVQAMPWSEELEARMLAAAAAALPTGQWVLENELTSPHLGIPKETWAKREMQPVIVERGGEGPTILASITGSLSHLNEKADHILTSQPRCVLGLLLELGRVRGELEAHRQAPGLRASGLEPLDLHDHEEGWARRADCVACQWWGPHTRERPVNVRWPLPVPGLTGLLKPAPAHLYCPACGLLHVDEGEWATRPHRTHECQRKSCKKLWRPFEFPTVGVRPPEPPSAQLGLLGTP